MKIIDMPEFAFEKVIGSTEIIIVLHANKIIMSAKGSEKLFRAVVGFVPKIVVVKVVKIIK
ncbi:hypothetical protein D9M71_653850 [compost metagenome]|jgi:hypothetical protein